MRWWWSLLVVGFLVDPGLAAAKRLPNVVLLYADDMGYGDLAIQNPQARIATPHLDQLTREGMRFTDAHSSSAICSPSRYALLTGRHHWRQFHGIVNSFGPTVFQPGRLTLAQMLRTQGYRTACIGKWHLGWDWEAIKKPGARPVSDSKGYAPTDFDWNKPIPGGPLAQGFDFYFGDDVPNFPPYAWIENDRVLQAPTVPLTLSGQPVEGNWECRPGPMVKDWAFDAVMPALTDKAVEWIGKQKPDRPFFLYFPFTSPHAPMVPTKEFQGKSRVGGYGDFLMQTDASVGRVLKALADHGFRENTLVIFSSDNGPEGYAYERIRRFEHRSMGPLRGLKRDLWEGGHRVPFLVRWPGVVTPGRVCEELVSQIDVMATLANVVGFDLPTTAAEDSHDLLPLLQGKAGSPRTTLVHNTNKDQYALRSGDWLYLDVPTGEVTKVPPWYAKAQGYEANSLAHALYDLRVDLGQRNNLAQAKPEVVARLRKELHAIRQRGFSAPRLLEKTGR